MKCTIKDIARLSGVSPSTVSRVISGNARISDETQARVRKIMEETHYQPNLLARSLVKCSASALCVFTKANPEETMKQSFFSEALRGMAVEASASRRQLLISAQEEGSDNPALVRQIISGGMADGVILLVVHPRDSAVALLREAEFPFVLLGSPDEDTPASFVDNDNVSAGREATAYLLRRGHRRIALMGADERYTVNLHRKAGYFAALEAAGLSRDDRLLIDDPLRHPEAVRRLMTAPDAPTALIALDDSVGLYLLGALKEWGVRVPEQASLLTFNNNPVAPYLTPPLTSVEVYPYELGREAVKMLMGVIADGGNEARRAYVPVNLIERDSVRSL